MRTKNTSARFLVIAILTTSTWIARADWPWDNAQSKVSSRPLPQGEENRPLATPAPAKRALPTKPSVAQAQSQLFQDVQTYQAALREFATNAGKIVASFPEKAQDFTEQFAALRSNLDGAKTNLDLLLKSKPKLSAYGDQVFGGMAQVSTGFEEVARQIDVCIDERRRGATNDAQAVEATVKALDGIKQACILGKAAMTPLRDAVSANRREADAAFAQLELYPTIIDFAVRACDLWIQGIGDPTAYASVVQGLWQARDNLRGIVQSFLQAADKAGEAIRKMPPTLVPPVT